MRVYRRRVAQLGLENQLHPALLEAIELRLAYTLAAYLPRAVWNSLVAGTVLDQTKPKVVVTMHLPGDHAMHALVVEGQKRGTPTVFVQHGIMGARNAFHAPLPYDRVLVFHRLAAELLAGKGRGPEPEIVGSPFYDEITPEYGADRDEGYVLVVSQPDEQIERRRSAHCWLAIIFRVCRELGREVIVKIHPNDAANIPYYQRVAQQSGGSVQIVRHGQQPLAELIAYCTLFVSRHSITLLDAVLAGKPALMVNLTSQPNSYPFPQPEVVTAAYSPEELRTTLQRLLEYPAARADLQAARDEYINYHIGPTDGHAAQRIAAAVAECAEKSG